MLSIKSDNNKKKLFIFSYVIYSCKGNLIKINYVLFIFDSIKTKQLFL